MSITLSTSKSRPGWIVDGFQVRLFDVGPAIEERYTVVLMSYYPPERVGGRVRQRVMWALKPDGSCRELLAIAGAHLGQEIPFTDLPIPAIEAVIAHLPKYEQFRKKRRREQRA